MLINKVSLKFFLAAAVFTSGFMLSSCAPRITKGDVYQEVSKNIRIGADKLEVMKYVDSLEVSSIKPTKYGYVRGTSGYPVIAPDGKKVEVEGIVSASFRNGEGWFFSSCNYVGVIFYFDKSNKLITYRIDCFS